MSANNTIILRSIYTVQRRRTVRLWVTLFVHSLLFAIHWGGVKIKIKCKCKEEVLYHQYNAASRLTSIHCCCVHTYNTINYKLQILKKELLLVLQQQQTLIIKVMKYSRAHRIFVVDNNWLVNCVILVITRTYNSHSSRSIWY